LQEFFFAENEDHDIDIIAEEEDNDIIYIEPIETNSQVPSANSITQTPAETGVEQENENTGKKHLPSKCVSSSVICDLKA